MKYEKTEEHVLIRDSIKSYLDKEVTPKVEEFDGKGEFPAEIFRTLAEMGTDTYAIRCMCNDLLEMMQSGKYDVTRASMVKAFAAEAVIRHTSNAIQIFGGSGYITEYPVERYFRDARVWAIGGGTTQIQDRLC